ncbi:vitamin B12-dependent ribonucleotide reductase [Caloramator australicus]|uniref:Vitamin B12-dependent ribonucleotide reductase n=1 Tax=Caloramator australicus RC3 TaxID=857293 RepID=I7KT20_9CLOT|nr:vitamin B12-dependent ribonucleotide reductase [Caloramator australicus]CCJ32823.1 Ribonucleotide reductase of class II (coenzyme B12-dependent) [Caloramator australicus RC3]
MELTQNAIKVLEKRYLAKDENGSVIETVDEMFRRVARTIAKADKLYDENASVEETEEKFYNLMTSLRFIPNSPTLMNAGRPLGQLSACFVLPVEDSMEGIFDSIKNAALIHKSGGGTGFSFSRLRPKGSTVKTTGGVASGPVSFMKVFNAATEAVKQGGTRRGANMAILRVDHPDIMEFIKCKEDNKEINNFNISVALTEKFMEAAIKGEDYELIDPNTKTVKGKLNAKEVFDLIVKMAWTNGEPGIIFLDRMNEKNPTPNLGEIESTNPCGEQPLLPYESCNLGSINLAKMVKKVGEKYEIDYELLEKTIFDAVHFLDNVIDVNVYPLPEIERMTKKTRKIGLGVMGFADMLILLGIPYNSEEAVDLADNLMKFINEKSKEASEYLARERGPFPEFYNSIYKEGPPLRNATTTTIAPTGTISIIAGVSSGIEPLFAVAFWRNVLDNEKLVEVHYLFEKVMRERGLYSKELMDKIAEHGTIQEIEEIPLDIKRIFVTAHDISPVYHIRMQAAFQKWTDNAVSKTVNFKKDATIEDVKTVYLLAYKLGCKGVTIYRDGSREGQVINVGLKEKSDDSSTKPRVRPEVTMGITEKVRIGCGNLYITVNYDENGICEVFTNLGKAGGCPSQSEATARLVSIALRSGMDVKEIIEQLKGIRCHSTLRQMATNKDIKVLSCPDAIAKTIEKLVNLKELEKIKESISADMEIKNLIETKENKILCPECGNPITHEGGCVICPNCGYSKCG